MQPQRNQHMPKMLVRRIARVPLAPLATLHVIPHRRLGFAQEIRYAAAAAAAAASKARVFADLVGAGGRGGLPIF